MVHSCRRRTTPMRLNLDAPPDSGRWRSGPQAAPSAQIDSAYCRRPKPANFEPNSAVGRPSGDRHFLELGEFLDRYSSRARHEQIETLRAHAVGRAEHGRGSLSLAARYISRSLLTPNSACEPCSIAPPIGSPLDVRQACQDPPLVQSGHPVQLVLVGLRLFGSRLDGPLGFIHFSARYSGDQHSSFRGQPLRAAAVDAVRYGSGQPRICRHWRRPSLASALIRPSQCAASRRHTLRQR
jgi:hypothetical protein